MRHLIETKKQKGQALVEMFISTSVLFLLAAGIVQFSILFLSRVQFEHSCSEAARQYCAGLIDKNSLPSAIYENLGPFQKYFDSESLTVSVRQPRATAGALMDKVRSAIHFIPLTLNYDGAEWVVEIKCVPPFLLKILFSNGVTFHSVMQAYRYEGRMD